MDRSEAETWQTVARGWERQSASFTAATAGLIERLVELCALRGDETVLELAAGPGETGFAAAARLVDGGRLLSSDFAPEMVEVARRRGSALGLGNVEYRTLDAMAIDLADASVDVVLCRFGVMLTPDPAVALAEIARVLRPGGRVALAVWAEAERNLWISATGAAARELGLTATPGPDEPGPFRLADPARLRRLVEGAGLEVDAIGEVAITWRAGSLDEWWETVVDTSPTLSALVREVPPADFDRVREASQARITGGIAVDGSVSLTGAAIAVGATRSGS
ncbi:MAG: methyltransferase domain-containing protein [Gaiellales bacterium]